MNGKLTQVSKIEVLNAIPGSKGLIRNIEEALGCTRDAVKDCLKKYPELQKEMSDEAEREKDEVMNNLIEDAKAGDKAARELFLKSQARDGGFGDKAVQSDKGNQPLVFLHSDVTDLTSNAKNGSASKQTRIFDWSKKATDYHAKQMEEANSKSVDELLAPKKRVRK